MVKHESRPGPRVAIVTGAGIGLGRAYARRLAADGLRVIVNNRRREVDAAGRGSADHVVDEILAAGGEAVANYEDVCAEGAGARMVEQALSTWGRLDALVNNASSFFPTTVGDITETQWNDLSGTNLQVPLFLAHGRHNARTVGTSGGIRFGQGRDRGSGHGSLRPRHNVGRAPGLRVLDCREV